MYKERISRYNKKMSRIVLLGLALFLVGLTFIIPSYVFGAKKIKLTAQPTDKTVKLYWETNTEGIDEFLITKTSKEETTQIKVSGNKSFYIDSEVAQRTDYSYQVYATRKGKKVEASNEEKNIILVKADNPHGMYSNATSLCSTCHKDKEDVKGESPAMAQAKLCFNCHVDMEKHFTDVKISGSIHPVMSQDVDLKCTDCHNPHKTADENNPSILNLSFKLNDGSILKLSEVNDDFCFACHDDGGKSAMMINKKFYTQSPHAKPMNLSKTEPSSKISCKNCHTSHASEFRSLLKFQFDPFSKKTDIKNNQLCFSCHGQASKTNIVKLYNGNQDGVNKGHYIKDKELANSLDLPVGWKLSCADCHDTHGTENDKAISDKLGEFKSITNPVKKEREICTSCHAYANDSGKKSIFRGIFFAALPDTVAQHTANPSGDLKSCSSCHGSNNMVAGAHAPKSGLTPRPPKNDDKPGDSEEPKTEEPAKEPQPTDESEEEPSNNDAPSGEQTKDDSTVRNDAYTGTSGQ